MVAATAISAILVEIEARRLGTEFLFERLALRVDEVGGRRMVATPARSPAGSSAEAEVQRHIEGRPRPWQEASDWERPRLLGVRPSMRLERL